MRRSLITTGSCTPAIDLVLDPVGVRARPDGVEDLDARLMALLRDGRGGLVVLEDDLRGVHPEPDGDLGVRLTSALNHSFRQGTHKVIAIASDVPNLSSELMTRAFRFCLHLVAILFIIRLKNLRGVI